MALAGFFVGWQTAPPLFAWFVTALDGFLRLSDPTSWSAVYFKFALGAAGLFSAQIWATRIAGFRTPSAPTVLIYLLVGIAASVASAISWHSRIDYFRHNLANYDFIVAPTPGNLPCLSIPFAGLIASFCIALVYRSRRWLHRLFDDIFRPNRVVARYDY